jgi:integrase
MVSKKNGRRGNQDGSVTQRNDGRWEARISLPNGKRKSFYGRTEKEVKQKMRKAQQDLDAGLPLVSERNMVDSYLKSFLEVKQHRLDVSSYLKYRRYYRAIVAEIGHVSLVKLSPHHIQQLHAALLKKAGHLELLALLMGS